MTSPHHYPHALRKKYKTEHENMNGKAEKKYIAIGCKQKENVGSFSVGNRLTVYFALIS